MNRPLSQFAGRYRERTPPPVLRDHVVCSWINDLTRSSADGFLVVPDGCVDILWNGAGLSVAGPDTRPVLEQVRPGSVSGIRFRPGAAQAWLGVPLSDIRNARVPLSELWKDEAARLAERLSAAADPPAATAVLQEALVDRLPRVGDADRAIAFVRYEASLTSGTPDARGFRDVSRRMGLSDRTLRRRCVEAFGYGFKTLQKILRFQRLLHLAARSPGASLSELALTCGFADHAHMAREVRTLCGTTPSELRAALSR